jgi:penicillin-binding protein 1C
MPSNRCWKRSVSPAVRASRVATTLDLDLQHILERQIGAYVARNGRSGIHNASAILVDTRDMGVKALVGSANYFDRALLGQVNGTLARRSPGSTLKPFIYALGFDQGILHPQTVLRDVPTSFGPYTPENFDGRFLGPITATDALNRSRNIPAVWIASQLHAPDLYQFLQSAGIGHLASEQHYGLALVLGGGEVSMQELAGLYAMLANRGVLKPLRFRADDLQSAGTRLLSAEASFMVMDMLRQHVRPDESSGAQPQQTPIYWKTGTSWAFRDAWTAGSFGPYVLVVWVGNFDGTRQPGLCRRRCGGALVLPDRGRDRGRASRSRRARAAKPANLARVEICLASGELPNRWCPQRGMTWFIPGKSPIRVSNVHRPVTIDDATGLPACPPYEGKHVHEEIFEFWPSDLEQVFAEAGIPRRKPPQNPACTNAGAPEGRAADHLAIARQRLCHAPDRTRPQAHRLQRHGRCRCAHGLLVCRRCLCRPQHARRSALLATACGRQLSRARQSTIAAAATSGPGSDARRVARSPEKYNATGNRNPYIRFIYS